MTRNEALEILDHNWTRLVNPDYTDEELGKAQDMAIEALEALKRNRGLWLSIQQGDQGYSAGDFICSCCGKPNKCYSITDYCANCGAKMERAKSKKRKRG